METTQEAFKTHENAYSFVECCRSCAQKYEFRLENSKIVTVICGKPEHRTYTAVSYVWETAADHRIPLKCRGCGAVKWVPMRDTQKLRRLLEFVRGGSTVWLDALSIDQDDLADKNSQLPVMGTIYQHAEMTSVFLPRSDKEAYLLLKDVGFAADTIVKAHEKFGVYGDGSAGEISTETERLEQLATDFIEKSLAAIRSLQSMTYWQRAWTFQEWTMASEVRISCEANEDHEAITGLKNLMIMATMVVYRWKQLAFEKLPSAWDIDTIKARLEKQRELGSFIKMVKDNFPFGDFLSRDGSDEPDHLREMTFLPVTGETIHDSGPTSMGRQANDSFDFNTMLSLALNAITANRPAKPLGFQESPEAPSIPKNVYGIARRFSYEGDLVACWASMCNIDYEYNTNDSYPEALRKVVATLRSKGIRIYNWLANTDSGEVDVAFLKYAGAHRQINGEGQGFFVGSPIFIGRADTVTHVLNSLLQEPGVVHLPASGRVTLRQIERVVIQRPVSWSNTTQAVSKFRSVLSGHVDGERLKDVCNILQEDVESIPESQRSKHQLITVQIGVDDQFTSLWYFNAWATIPHDVQLQHLFVARESLNGTLVFAAYKGKFGKGNPAKEAQIISYLNISHQRDGTYLIKTDENGVVDIIFRTSDTPEPELFWLPESISNTESLLQDRVLKANITLGTRTLELTKCLVDSSEQQQP